MSHSNSMEKEGSKGATLREGREKDRRVGLGSTSCVAVCEWVAEGCGPARWAMQCVLSSLCFAYFSVVFYFLQVVVYAFFR
jgi:hypothetical protein